MSHECPVPDCAITIGDHKLMCRQHWFALPIKLQNRVYRAWAGGYGADTAEHAAAMQEAIMHHLERIEKETHAETQ